MVNKAPSERWCQEQGSDSPSRPDHSAARDGHQAFARMPDSVQMVACSTSAGGERITLAVDDSRPFVAASITAWKMGPAPVTPDELRSGVRSKFPTHTPTVTS